MKRAVFLDRDGTINEIVYFPDLGLLDSPLAPDQFKLIPGVTDGIRLLKKLGFKVVVVSNQPGIAKGKLTEYNFKMIKLKMREELGKSGVSLDAEYYCLHHPNAKNPKYKMECNCRKPKPGLLIKAAKDLKLDLSESYMIGDSWTDVKAGKSVGCRTFLIGMLKCDVCKLMEYEKIVPDFIVRDLLEASKIIEREEHNTHSKNQ